MKKFLLAGGLASILVLGACGGEDAELGDDSELGEDAEDVDHGTGDQDEADNEVGEEGQSIDGGSEDEIGEGENPDEEDEADSE